MAANSKIVLKACDLSKVYACSTGDTLTAVSGVSLTVGKGEIVSIVGPSGCGKTTLLRLLAGLSKPTDGSITMFDDLNPKASNCTSFVFQKPLLFPWRTVEENVLLPI